MIAAGDASAKESNNWFILVFVLLLLLIGVAGVLYPSPAKTTASSTIATSSSNIIQTGDVRVFGLVSTTGAGTHPVSLNFTSLRTSTTFVASVSSGQFSIQLPNQDTYNATMEWNGNYTWQRGQVSAGAISLNMAAGSKMAQSDNLNLPTPDSVVTVNGTIPWQVVTSHPVNVRFTASDGENFTAGVSADETFSLPLPNMMDYQVNIQSQNSTGFQEWYYAHTLQITAGVNVFGLFVRVSL